LKGCQSLPFTNFSQAKSPQLDLGRGKGRGGEGKERKGTEVKERIGKRRGMGMNGRR